MKRQRKIRTEDTDRFILTTEKDMGDKIRQLADKEGLTLSHFLATIVEPVVEKRYKKKIEGGNKQ